MFISELAVSVMYFESKFFYVVFLALTHLHSSTSSTCSEYYSYQYQSPQTCECDDVPNDERPSAISLKCTSLTVLPKLYSFIHYNTIDFESCSNELNFQYQTFENLTINFLRIRHCNLMNLDEQTFSNIKQLEKFSIENSTIMSMKTSTGNFQDLFSVDSFKRLKSLTLKNLHYHQINKHDRKLNLELLLQQLMYLHRLELANLYIDNYRYYDIKSIGTYLTHLSLTNTHQNSLLPIEYLTSLERLLIRNLPNVFHTQPFIGSLGKLKKLKYILFEHNQLRLIDDLRSDSIDDIDLNSNLIEYIDEYTFEHVPKLRQLTLTGNPLNYIDRNAFCGVENLQRLTINMKHTKISPLDNCILVNYPTLNIIQDSQTSLQCNCQLLNIFYLKRQNKYDINRLFTLNQICLFRNHTTYDKPIHLHELENYLNCSSLNYCTDLCQYRQIKILPTNIQIKSKYSSLSTSLYSFYSHLLSLLLLCFLYL